MTAIRIIVSGHVQGVFFRANTKEEADRLGITGWVRNTDNGNVEMHTEGSEDALEKLKKWCQKGPPSARVENVIAEHVPEEHFMSFVILR